tara:strand:- start:33 stop:227 length:195 start_codon:yes stop_codon:yes gene_type:complete
LLSNAYQREITGIDWEKKKNDSDFLEVAQGVSKAVGGEEETIFLRSNQELEAIGARHYESTMLV